MTHGKTTQMNRTTAESSHLVAMISRGRATHYPTLTVKITGRYRAVDGLAQPHRKPSTHLPQIDRLMRTVKRGKRNVNCSNDSSAVRACSRSCTTGTRRSFTPASRKTSCANAIGQHREKFGRAEEKRGVAKSAPGCRAFAAERSCLATCNS